MWLTFYTPEGAAGYERTDPDAVVAMAQDGTPTTAGQLAAMPHTTPLGWENELVLAYAATFAEPKPNTCDQWAQIVYTAWQLMGQGDSRLVEPETVPRPRAGHKRDAREGVLGSSDVQLVNIHAAHRPSRAAAEEDAAASSGRRAPQYTCRWPVRPHRRDQCMNPRRRHAEGECEHEERLIPPHIKGPEGKPLRVRKTVNLWDTSRRTERDRHLRHADGRNPIPLPGRTTVIRPFGCVTPSARAALMRMLLHRPSCMGHAVRW